MRRRRSRKQNKNAWIRRIPSLFAAAAAFVSGMAVHSYMTAHSGTDVEETQDTVAEEQEEETDAVLAVSQTSAEESENAEAVMRMEALETELESMVSGVDGTWSIYVKDLDADLEISINNQQMYAASLIKLFVMQSCYDHMDQLIANDIVYSGSEEQSYEKLDELLTTMITVSDNEAYNQLVRMHSASESFTEGCALIEDYLQESDYENTGIFHTLHPSDSLEESISDQKNYTSAEDCGKLLESIYRGTCVSETASAAMLDLLMQQQSTQKIPAGVPEWVLTANKTGETDEVQHDAAIVFGDETDYILCVMSSDIWDSESAVYTIQDISSVAYEYLNGTGTG